MSEGAAVVFLIFIVVWILFGYWGGAIAHSKGRSEFVGVLFGLLGIVGILLLWLFPTNRRELWEREQRWARERRES